MSDKPARDAGQMYEVFGRQSERRPLTHLGSLHAPNSSLAVARAWFVYSERKWIELCVAPSDAFESCMGSPADHPLGMA